MPKISFSICVITALALLWAAPSQAQQSKGEQAHDTDQVTSMPPISGMKIVPVQIPQSNQAASLIVDMKAHADRCGSFALSPSVLSQSCANERASLIDRQHQLNVSDTELANAGVRGFK